MPNIMIDQIDSKMLDTIVSTLHSKPNFEGGCQSS